MLEIFPDLIRRQLRHIHFLENLVSYIADNTGDLFSADNISKYLKNQRINTNVQTIITYLQALKNSFIVNPVPDLEFIPLQWERSERVIQRVFLHDFLGS